MGDRALELGHRLELEREVGISALSSTFSPMRSGRASGNWAGRRGTGCAPTAVGMLHLVDRFMPLELGELGDAPIVEHPVMQPILVDRGQLVLERFVEQLDDLRRPSSRSPTAEGDGLTPRGTRRKAEKMAEISENDLVAARRRAGS
jgi:hypothetical protein